MSRYLYKFGLVLGWAIVIYVLGLTLFFKNNWRVDLEILMHGAQKIEAGISPYNLSDRLEHTKAPVITMFFIPLNWLPQKIVFVFWDLLNLAIVTGWMLYFSKVFSSHKIKRSTAILICFLLLLNPINTEVWTGQFNLIIFSLMIFSASQYSSALRGLALFFGLALKPSYLLFAPWILWYSPQRLRLVLCSILWAVISLAIYSLAFGADSLWLDHKAWSVFLPQSTIKHLSETVNHGLPSWVHHVFNTKPLLTCRIFLFSGLACALLLTFTAQKWRAFSVISILVTICSPMTWFQNYALLIPYCFMLIQDASASDKTLRWPAFLALIPIALSYPLNNPEVMKLSLGFWYLADTRVPLWGAVVSLLVWGISLAVMQVFDSIKATPLIYSTTKA